MTLTELATVDLIITANQRQALDLRRSLRLDATRIKAWPDFVHDYYVQVSSLQDANSRYLSVFEQRVLWQQVIGQESDFTLKQDEALISACMSAWSWLSDWQIPLSALNAYPTDDSAWFYKMAQHYRAACHRHAGIDSQQALAYLFAHMSHLCALLPKKIVFYRFWQAPPSLVAFQAELGVHTISSHFYQPETLATLKTWRYEAESKSAELAALVHWSCEQAEQHPQQRIACVLKDLHQDRALLEYYFKQRDKFAVAPQIHFSLGPALIDYPLIQAAWRLIHLQGVWDIALDDLSYLSHSPFWYHAAELETLLSLWRGQQLTFFPAIGWRSFATEVLQHWWTAVSELPRSKALPSEHLANWRSLLQLSGWPQQELSDHELAVSKRYEALELCFANLDDFLGELTHAEATEHWHALLTQTRFEVPAKKTPQIYFLGLWEALGSDFDVLWLSEVSQYQWPNFPRANVLIPVKCQEAYGLPKATGENNRLAEEHLWQALLSSSGQVIASWSLWNKGEMQKSVPCIATWPKLTWLPPLPITTPATVFVPRPVEALPIAALQVPGGTAALRSQAHCPFQAFARYRLKLRALAMPELALSASERGLLVHHVLCNLWQVLQNQQTLIALTPEALSALIKTSCRQTLKTLNPWRKKYLSQTLQQLEQQRLERLCAKWLALEAQRPAFRTEQLEQSVEISFATKTWRLRMDRIDQLASGERILMDYKTGLASINWQAEPLLEPQLPFYALLNPLPIDALVIAEVTSRVSKMHGLAAVPTDCGPLGQLKVADDWGEQCHQWLRALEQLASDYIAGKADVAPVKGASTCLSCDLARVCRIKDSPMNH